MKKTFKKIIRKFKTVWDRDFRDILVPLISLFIFIILIFVLGIIWALVILVAINALYFGINILRKKLKPKKKKNDKAMVSKKGEKEIKTKKKKKWKKILKVFLMLMLVFFIFAVIAIIIFIVYIVSNAPDFDESNLYVTAPSVILDKKGNEIAKLGEEKRIIIDYDEVPEVLIDAIIATEDSRFFKHNGVDWARFIKASAYQLLGKSSAGGASTLTMQISKNAYTSDEASGWEGIKRKFTDVYVSMFIIEKNYTKEQIMEFYVNSQWLAKHTYGVEQTALTYFGKSAKDLNLSEAAMIAGLFQAPGKYDPYKNPEATENRRLTVLKLMLRHGYISKDEYEIAKKMTVEKIVISQEKSSYSSGELSKYQSFIDTVVDEVKEKTGKNPYNTPMTIYTTLDTGIQDYVNGIMNGETYDWENKVVQAGVAIINVKDGSVAAIGGGRNVSVIDGLNYATEITNQIGSTAKPLYDYGPAIEYNNWGSGQPIPDEPITYSNGVTINNWDGGFQGYETMRVALAGSRNIPALKTFKKNDKAKVIEFVTNLGLTPEIYSCPSGYKRDKKKCINKKDINDVIDATKADNLHEAHAIGGYNGESPLTMAAAYAAFSNGGVYTAPYTFTKLVYNDTGEEFVNKVEKKQAMSPETAYIVTDMLQTTATQALGGYYYINGIRYAAKTGTTNFDEATIQAHHYPYWAANDLWTVGYNTEYAIGVWYGYEHMTDEYYNTVGSGEHLRLFQAMGKKVFTNGSAFPMPSGVVSVELETGCAEPCLPSEYTPKAFRITELFIRGSEPSTVSTRFEKLKNVSNLKASVENEVVTLTWDTVKTPEINTEKYLREYFKQIFENEGYLNAYVRDRLSYNVAHIGSLGYNVYLKDADGNLKLLDFVSANKYNATMEEVGEYTFVVKTAYSIYKGNMSDGKNIKATVTNVTPSNNNEEPGDDTGGDNSGGDNSTNNP